MNKLGVCIFCISLLAFRCYCQMASFSPRPHIIVYKTRKDFSDRVPVVISSDGNKLTSYPDPVDIRAVGLVAKPVRLNKGFLLSTYGIGLRTRFLKLTFEKFGKLERTPGSQELLEQTDRNYPFLEICDCGTTNRNKDSLIVKINEWIDHDLLKEKCKILKQ